MGSKIIKKSFVAACLALGLVPCGGGGSAGESALSAEAPRAKTLAIESTLAGQEISLLDTTTSGDQVFRAKEENSHHGSMQVGRIRSTCDDVRPASDKLVGDGILFA